MQILERKLSSSSGVKQLKGYYLKLEEPGLRPEYREFDSLPSINFKSTGSAFDSPTKRKLRGATGGATNRGGARTGNEANNSSRRDRYGECT